MTTTEWRRYYKDQAFTVYGYECACCGVKEKEFLTLDHKNNDGYKNRRCGYTWYRWLKTHNYPSDIQTLCFNCNFGKNVNDGICPHKASSLKIK